MLILVGVTINLATNGGLFEKARTAKTGTQREVDREHLLAALMTGVKEGGDFDITEVTLPTDMEWCEEGDSEYPGNEITPIKGQGCWVITKNNNKFYVNENGNLSDTAPMTYEDALAKGWVYVEYEGYQNNIVIYGGGDSSVTITQTINNVPFFKGEKEDSVFMGYKDVKLTDDKVAVTFIDNESIETVDFCGLNVVLEGDGFAWCKNLTNVTGMEGMTEIPSGAFSGCTSLTNITIPSNIIKIGDGDSVFDECTNLTQITINKAQDSISGAPWGAPNATVTWQG